MAVFGQDFVKMHHPSALILRHVHVPHVHQGLLCSVHVSDVIQPFLGEKSHPATLTASLFLALSILSHGCLVCNAKVRNQFKPLKNF